MMIHYLDAQGRLAEVRGFNALGQGYLHFIPYEYRWDGDYLQRLLRTKKAVAGNRDKIDPQTYKALSGFARGVNAYIEEHRAQIPRWVEPITPEDVEAQERSHYFRFYSINEALIKLTNLPQEFPNLGSDQFAISPLKSANGRVIHLEETHMPWANRFQNYEAHLITPGKLNAGGISWLGSPFFLDGFNDKITWSATWNFPNISDVYEEKITDTKMSGEASRWSTRPSRSRGRRAWSRSRFPATTPTTAPLCRLIAKAIAPTRLNFPISRESITQPAFIAS
jgi:acyl-homoserine lactone acylase PvdQ